MGCCGGGLNLLVGQHKLVQSIPDVFQWFALGCYYMRLGFSWERRSAVVVLVLSVYFVHHLPGSSGSTRTTPSS